MGAAVTPCLDCGADIYPFGGRCVTCAEERNRTMTREFMRLWRKANPASERDREKARERSRLWRKANPEKARKKNRKNTPYA